MHQGELVRLRAMEPADAEVFYAWINDPEVREHLAARYPFSMRTENDWVEAHQTVSYANVARQQFYKRGGYVDMVLMGLLCDDLRRAG